MIVIIVMLFVIVCVLCCNCYIKVLCSKLNSNIEEEYPDITMQLIKNATDHNNTLVRCLFYFV